MMRRRAWTLFRLVSSLVLVAGALRAVDRGALWAATAGADPGLLLASFAMYFVAYAISSTRWRGLLAAVGARVPLLALLRACVIATFFNNFLPTTIGGDVFRAYDVTRRARLSLPASVSVIALERLLGTAALLALSVGAFFLEFRLFARDRFVVVALVVAVGALLMVGVGLQERVFQRLMRLLAFPLLARLQQHAQEMYRTLQVYRAHRGALAQAALLSVLLQITVIVHYYLLSRALHQRAPLFFFFLVIPILLVVLQFAPSINGIGYREVGFVLLLAKSGMAAPVALSLSLIAFGMRMGLSVLGGLLFAWGGNPAERVGWRQFREAGWEPAP